jgi:L-amino acid N-acyltransferase YncA
LLIRDAHPDDMPAMAAIYAHYVHHSVVTFETEAPTAQDWLDTLAAQDSHGLPTVVGEDDGVVIGFAFLKRWRPRPGYRHTVEDSVYLDKAHVGRGHGRARPAVRAR